MTDDDLAEMVALGWNLDPSDREVIELVKGTTSFAVQRLRLEATGLGVAIERDAPRWLRRFIRRWTK